MKLVKSSILAMLALSAVSFTSCDGGKDAEYTPGAESQGAYFTATADRYTLEEGDATISIPVARCSAADPATANVKANVTCVVDGVETDVTGKFVIPTEVVFNGSELTSTFVIGYKGEDFEYDLNYNFKLEIENANIYGTGTYAFVGVRPAPWKSLGMATYTDGIMMGLYNINQLTYEVEIQESLTNPGIYRLVNPYAAGVFGYSEPGDMVSTDPYYMVINAEDPTKVYVEQFSTNMIWDADLGVMSFTSYAYYYLQKGTSLDAIANNGFCGEMENGIITMPDGKKGFLFTGTVGDYDGSWYTLANAQGWRVVLPGYSVADYSCDIAYAGRYTDVDEQTSLLANVTLGADVETARVAAAVTSDAATLYEAIVEGTVDYVEINTSTDGVKLPVSESGVYTIMVVTFGGGEDQEVAYVQTEVSLGGSEWEDLGVAYILDGWMLSAAQNYADVYDQFIWSFPIQRSTKRAGIYRLCNPYGETSPMASLALPGIYNIEVNASDANDVYIEPQWNGCGLFGQPLMMATKGYFADLPAEERGTFDGKTFYFPAKTCFFSEDGESWYLTRNAGAFEIDDEGATTASTKLKAVKTGATIGTATQRMKATPYVPARTVRRHTAFERAY